MKNLLQLHFYAEKDGKKHASLWGNLLCGSLAIYSLLRPGKLNQSCGSNPPTAAFFRLLCFVHLPQKVRGIFALKMRKTGSAAVRSTTTEPVFVDFTVFWAIFALKARKLPDLSGRQIRQLIWCERGDLNSHRIKLPLEPESSASAIPPLPLDTNYLIIEPAFCKV